jgi:hypothetical protein
MLILLAGLLYLLSNLLKSVGDVCFLRRLIDVRMDEAMDRLGVKHHMKRQSLHKNQSCHFFEQSKINLLTRNLGVGQSICKIHKLLEFHSLTILDSFRQHWPAFAYFIEHGALHELNLQTEDSRI